MQCRLVEAYQGVDSRTREWVHESIVHQAPGERANGTGLIVVAEIKGAAKPDVHTTHTQQHGDEQEVASVLSRNSVQGPTLPAHVHKAKPEPKKANQRRAAAPAPESGIYVYLFHGLILTSCKSSRERVSASRFELPSAGAPGVGIDS